MFPQYPYMPYYYMPQQNLNSDIARQKSIYQTRKPTRAQRDLKKLGGGLLAGSALTYFYLKILNKPGAYQAVKDIAKKFFSWIKI